MATTADCTLTETQDPHLASRGSRLLARVLDILVFWAPPLPIFLPSYPHHLTFTGPLLLVSLVSVPVQWALLSARGQSIGKLIVGIAIVDRNGNRAGFLRGLVARELLRWSGWILPLTGCAVEAVDSMLIFNGDRRTGHDRVAGTFVVQSRGAGAGPRLSEVRDLPLPRATLARIAALGLTALVGLALVPMALFAPFILRAPTDRSSSELKKNVDAIRLAELFYHLRHRRYLPVSSEAEALRAAPGAEAVAWLGSEQWDTLGWSAKTPVYGAYWVEVTGDDLRVVGVSDIDGDGRYMVYEATKDHRAAPGELARVD